MTITKNPWVLLCIAFGFVCISLGGSILFMDSSNSASDAPASEQFTIVTSRQYQMAFYLLKHDPEHKAYILLLPETSKELVEMLHGNFSRPLALVQQQSDLPYNVTLPPVRFVVVHEGMELGPMRACTPDGHECYNAKEFMDDYADVVQRTTIPSDFPNARTWVYEVKPYEN